MSYTDPDGGKYSDGDSWLFGLLACCTALVCGTALVIAFWPWALIALAVVAVFIVGLMVGILYTAERFFDGT